MICSPRAPPWMTAAASLVLAVVLWLVPSVARADLRVTSIEHGEWPATVAALQADRQSEGRSVHLVVSDENGRRSTCGAYTLSFDAIGAQAFALGGCDPATQATEVLLMRRSALFSHDDIVARPLPVGVSAVEIRTTSVVGGAVNRGGSEVNCTVAVRPFLRDMESGAIVHLTPGRFVLRPLASNVTAAASTDGWSLTSLGGGITVDYEVVDTRRGEVVLRDRATLSCSVTDLQAMRAPPPVTGGMGCSDATEIPFGAAVQGTLTAGVSRMRASCGAAAPGSEQVFALDLPAPQRVRGRLSSSFDGVLYVRSGCGPSDAELVCNDDQVDTRHSQVEVVLPAGRSYFVVDAYAAAGAGTFELAVEDASSPAPDVTPVHEAPRPMATCDGAPTLDHDSATEGSTVGMPDAVHASCGAQAQSPEAVYRLVLQDRSRVQLQLTSEFDGVLYLRSGCGDAGLELGCNDDDPDTRHSALDVTLNPGVYFVYVDGYSNHHFGTYTLTNTITPHRMGMNLRAGMTYSGSGTAYGDGLGVAMSTAVRLPVGPISVLLGVDYGHTSFSRGVAGTDLRATTIGAPVTFDVATANGLLHLTTSAELTLAVLHVERNGAAPDDVFALGATIRTGVELRVVRRFGFFSDVGYRFTQASSPTYGALLGNAAVFSLGATYGF